MASDRDTKTTTHSRLIVCRAVDCFRPFDHGTTNSTCNFTMNVGRLIESVSSFATKTKTKTTSGRQSVGQLIAVRPSNGKKRKPNTKECPTSGSSGPEQAAGFRPAKRYLYSCVSRFSRCLSGPLNRVVGRSTAEPQSKSGRFHRPLR